MDGADMDKVLKKVALLSKLFKLVKVYDELIAEMKLLAENEAEKDKLIAEMKFLEEDEAEKDN
jgi:hypothetical protein